MGDKKHIMPYDISIKLLGYKITFIIETVLIIFFGIGALYILPSECGKISTDESTNITKNIMYIIVSILILVGIIPLYRYGVDFYKNGSKYIQLVDNKVGVKGSEPSATPTPTSKTGGTGKKDTPTSTETPKPTVPLGEMCYE